jgi:hypothetical protein
MISTADRIADGFLVHTRRLSDFSIGEWVKVKKVLAVLEKDLISQIEAANIGSGLTAYRAARLETLLKQTRANILSTYKKISSSQAKTIKDIAKLERKVGASVLNNELGVSIFSLTMSAEALKTVISNSVIDGAPSASWWQRQARGLQDKFAGAVNHGYLLGETNAQIARRVRGTKAAGFKDGLMSVKRREAEALIRTSVMTVSNQTRLNLIEDGIKTGILHGQQQLSTLDGKTTPICQIYNGRAWKMKNGMYIPHLHTLPFVSTFAGVTHAGPPRHWNCRSTLVPWLKSWEEISEVKIPTPAGGHALYRAHFQKSLKDQGFNADEIAMTMERAKSSMTGQVSEELSYTQWVKRLSEGQQKEILGTKRFKLWKSGEIADLEDIWDAKGKYLTLKELSERSIISLPEDLYKKEDTVEKAIERLKKILEDGKTRAKNSTKLTDLKFGGSQSTAWDGGYPVSKLGNGERFHRFGGDNKKELSKLLEGGISSGVDELPLDTLNDLNKALFEFNRVCDDLNIPPIRGISIIMDDDKVVMSMGDGILSINKTLILERAKERKDAFEYFIKWRRNCIDTVKHDIEDYMKLITENPDNKKYATDLRYLKSRLKEHEKELEKMLAGDVKEVYKTNKSRWTPGNTDPNIPQPFCTRSYLDQDMYDTADMWHEFGHHIHQQFGVTNYIEYLDPRLERELEKITNKMLKPGNRIGRDTNSQGKWKVTQLSRYSETNHVEHFAESFAAYMNNNTKVLNPQMKKLLDSLLERVEYRYGQAN